MPVTLFHARKKVKDNILKTNNLKSTATCSRIWAYAEEYELFYYYHKLPRENNLV